MMTTASWAGATLQIANVDTVAGTLDISMENTEPVGGFQFLLDGITVTGASGGSAGDAEFTISNSETTVLAFSLTGAFIPAGSDTLIVVEYSGDGEPCISDLVFAGEGGENLEPNNDCGSIFIGDDDGPPECVQDCEGIEDINPDEDAIAFCEWVLSAVDSGCTDDCEGDEAEIDGRAQHGIPQRS